MANISELDPGASPLHFYGAELRLLREDAGLTLKELGAKIYCTGSLIGQIETARKVPTPQFTERVETVLDTRGVLGRLMKLVLRYEAPLQANAHAGLQATATHIYSFQPQLVHGLLQTEEYARAVLGVLTQQELEKRVRERTERRHILEREQLPLVWIVQEESALHQVFGGLQVMRNQLAHLLEAGRHDWVKIQVLPFTAGAHACTMGAFTIFRFQDQPDVCYTENYDVGRVNANPAANRDRWLRYAHMQAAALSVEDSLELIARVMEERYGEQD